MPSQVFFPRSEAVLVVGTTEIKGLRISFDITKTADLSANTAVFSVYNLGQEERASVQAKDQPIVFSAGYGGVVEEIFKGTVTFGSSQHPGVDWVTKIQAGDGITAIRKAKSYEAFPAGSKIQDIIEKLAGKLQKKIANKGEKKKGYLSGLMDAGKELVNGFTTGGPLVKELSKLCKDNDLAVSVQNGIVQITKIKDPITTIAYVLSADTGLVGIPELGKDGVLKARSFLNGELFPGSLVEMRTPDITGFYVVQKAKLAGDTVGTDFFVDIKGTLYK